MLSIDAVCPSFGHDYETGLSECQSLVIIKEQVKLSGRLKEARWKASITFWIQFAECLRSLDLPADTYDPWHATLDSMCCQQIREIIVKNTPACPLSARLPTMPCKRCHLLLFTRTRDTLESKSIGNYAKGQGCPSTSVISSRSTREEIINPFILSKNNESCSRGIVISKNFINSPFQFLFRTRRPLRVASRRVGLIYRNAKVITTSAKRGTENDVSQRAANCWQLGNPRKENGTTVASDSY